MLLSRVQYLCLVYIFSFRDNRLPFALSQSVPYVLQISHCSLILPLPICSKCFDIIFYREFIGNLLIIFFYCLHKFYFVRNMGIRLSFYEVFRFS